MSHERKLGDRIRELRAGHNMTLGELARQAHISKAYLSQLENHQTDRPSAQVLYQIASVLGTTVAALLGHPSDDTVPGVVIADALRKYADVARLAEHEVEMLARIRYRGKQPQTAEDWRYLHDSIKRSVS